MRKVIPFLFFFGVFVVLGVSTYLLREKNFFQNQDLKGIVLFYGEGCPHCAKVEQFIKENRIKEKITFKEKEVYFNKENARQLVEVAKKCGFNENEIGVPFLWDGENQKCIVGDEPIINFFKEKLNL
jgi:glutaredoxin